MEELQLHSLEFREGRRVQFANIPRADGEMLLITLEDGVLPVIGAAIEACFQGLGMHRWLFVEEIPVFDIGGANHKDNGDDGGEKKPPGMAHTGIYMVARVKIGITTRLPASPA